MTDDELRRALGNKLGWDGSTGYPSLSELVATGEGRLTEEQQRPYVLALINSTVSKTYPLTVLDCSRMFPVITAPAAVRARALLKVLPESSLTGGGGVG